MFGELKARDFSQNPVISEISPSLIGDALKSQIQSVLQEKLSPFKDEKICAPNNTSIIQNIISPLIALK